jgi:hypothetical protein
MLDTIDVLKNSKETKFDQVKVPKVVGEWLKKVLQKFMNN